MPYSQLASTQVVFGWLSVMYHWAKAAAAAQPRRFSLILGFLTSHVCIYFHATFPQSCPHSFYMVLNKLFIDKQ
jgi:hypothetical protein